MREPKIIFEDASLLVVDKPSGMVVNKAETAKEKTVQEWFEERNPGIKEDEGEFGQKGGVVHRLDKDTSGLMVLAKTPAAYEVIKQQFLERKTVKKYVALVHGAFSEQQGEVVQPVERHPVERKKFTIGKDLSRMAITEWLVRGKYQKGGESLSLVELSPHTGRTHQLRVHMQYLHHPIAGDPLYGWAKTREEERKWCGRLFLHAQYLEFTHPVSGERVHFESQLPEELEKILLSL